MGKYWEPLLEKKRAALRDPDWENMRANALTANIDDSNRSWVNEAGHVRLTREMWDKARARLQFGPDPYMTEYDYGNPYMLEVSNGSRKFRTSRAALDYALMMATIWSATKMTGQPRVVVEIGGGYGGLAVRGMQLWPGVTWCDLDFPEMTKIAEHYVYHCRKWNEPPTFVPLQTQAPYARADLVINTRSMMEMDIEEVNQYLRVMQEKMKPGALFYCLNREQKVTRMRDWAWDDKWAVLWRQPWPTNANLTEMLLVRAGALF